MGSWFYSTEYVLLGQPVRISGIVQAEGVIAAYKQAQFAVEQRVLETGNKPRKAVTFTAFNKV